MCIMSLYNCGSFNIAHSLARHLAAAAIKILFYIFFCFDFLLFVSTFLLQSCCCCCAIVYRKLRVSCVSKSKVQQIVYIAYNMVLNYDFARLGYNFRSSIALLFALASWRCVRMIIYRDGGLYRVDTQTLTANANTHTHAHLNSYDLLVINKTATTIRLCGAGKTREGGSKIHIILIKSNRLKWILTRVEQSVWCNLQSAHPRSINGCVCVCLVCCALMKWWWDFNYTLSILSCALR